MRNRPKGLLVRQVGAVLLAMVLSIASTPILPAIAEEAGAADSDVGESVPETAEEDGVSNGADNSEGLVDDQENQEFSTMEDSDARPSDNGDAVSDENASTNGDISTPSSDEESAVVENELPTGETENSESEVQEEEPAEEEEVDPADALAQKHRGTLAAGIYTIRVSNSANAVLDVQGGSANSGAKVNLWSRKATGDNQLWSVSEDENGYITLRNINSGLVLAASSATRGAQLVQATASDSALQKWVAIADASGYRLVSAADTSFVVDASRGSTKSGTKVELYTSNGGSNQRWIFSKTQPFQERLDALAKANASVLKNGTYAFKPSHKSTLSLDVQGASTSSGANVNLWTYGGRSNQVWEVSHDTKGYVTLKNAKSGKVLDASGSNVKQKTYNSSSRYQKWIAIKVGSSYKFVSAADDTKVLDVRRAGTSNGSETICYADSGQANQRWLAVSISKARAELNDYAYAHRNDLANGTYYLRASNSSKAVLDVQGASKSNSANINLWSKGTGDNQGWVVSHDSYGYVTFKNVNSGKALDVQGASAKSGARIIQYSSNGGWNQKWIAVKSGSGYMLVSAMNINLALGSHGGATANRTRVELVSKGSSAGKVWKAEAFDPVRSKMTSKAQRYSSKTKWLIMVDTTNNRLGIYTGSKGKWSLNKYWTCTTGASSTPTVLGEFTVQAKGYSFGSGYTCYYYTQFYGDYLFHSIKYNQGTFVIQDGRLGMNLSHGCVRLTLTNAKWIYNNIPRGTKVVTYR